MFNNRKDLILQNTKLTGQLTRDYTLQRKTGVESLDVGVGQAGIYMSGNKSDINQLIVFKLEKGLYEYQDQFEKIKSKLEIKHNEKMTDFSLEMTNKIFSKIIPDNNKKKEIYNNLKAIMELIKSIPNEAKELAKDQQLNPEVLIYYYSLIGFVLDQLSPNAEEKHEHSEFIAVSSRDKSKTDVYKDSILLAKKCNLTDLDQLRSTIGNLLPNAKKFYTRLKDRKLENLNAIPIENKNSLIGLTTITHLIINGLFPVGVGVNSLAVHSGFFHKQRLYTMDHDFQHCWDILAKLYNQQIVESLKIKNLDSLLNALNKIIKKSKINTIQRNDIIENYVIMFYLLHENPLLLQPLKEQLVVPITSMFKGPNIAWHEKDKDKKYEAILSAATKIFETGGFIYPFLEIYPDIVNELKMYVPSLIINETGNIPKISKIEYTSLSDQQIQNFIVIVNKHVAKSLESFLNKNETILVKHLDSPYIQQIKTEIDQLNSYSNQFNLVECHTIEPKK